ncbi:pyrroline-5-carboxylate reductase [Yinghuangia soli]|uniref:Pyrroline-5-carboxylate reductase n=1 Tax=Yinghuangia soli TaxID=2908204 RepID=A0AA41PUK7_9ACTN|nr:pyrroline-5-carboxylate reductase [Yinghuangia soli]MCF2526023.1 pyrroline-5-carboxylate reductase [Yinghuangia soli]
MDDHDAVAIVGLGHLGEAILRGLLDAGVARTALSGSTRSADDAERLSATYGVRVSADAREVVGGAGVVVLVVPPGAVAATLERVTPVLRPDAVVVSLAAGVSLARLGALLPSGTSVVRAMTNTAVGVREGMSCLSADARLGVGERARVQALFDLLGATLWVGEDAQPAATAIAGSGPAFLYHQASAMSDAALGQGLDADAVRTLVTQTLFGAAALMRGSADTPAALVEAVATPGGTTRAALDELDGADVPLAVRRAVGAAADRARLASGVEADPTELLPAALARWGRLPVTKVQLAADGAWEHPLVLEPGAEGAGSIGGAGGAVRLLDEWLDAQGEDVAVEVFFADRVFLGARTRDREFLHGVAAAVWDGRWRSLAAAPEYWRLPDGTALLSAAAPDTLEVGVVDAWKSVGSAVIWRTGETTGSPGKTGRAAADFGRLTAELREPQRTPVAVEAAWSVPIGHWIGMNVAAAEYRLDVHELDGVVRAFLGRGGVA